ncbi:tRNA lysidine(34) synthetase TilS [Ornithinibacillus halophilus]|uniref:tRNA(Ile)-lysidine synthase n=1 Tax=Ornithinibacillus halophilus TaxID=930117 RepID=A0A1M5JIR7_9BACI|nr:tRNA lysidine(34) synthetase TilS [Ornithinibacillus halophilus]SHG40442.1 tRNA(Ile)-lysidine synthase [Ornithinibacillus halophilus]
MKETVLDFIQRHQLLKKNSTVLVGVSGGPDSMALLHFLNSIKEEWKLCIYVLSVDHQLRKEGSKEDLEYVKGKCKEWGIAFIGTSLDVPTYKKKEKLGTQEAARKVRYQFFKEQIEMLNADYLALGHHGDDQVETMLMRLTRTADSSVFSGIPVKRQLGRAKIIRPFLCLTKKELEEYCATNGFIPRIDPTNLETNYTRNYFRKHVLPLLKEKNNNIHKTVQHLNETMMEDEEFLQNETKKVIKEAVEFYPNKKRIRVNVELFKSYASALQRRAYHLILNYLYDELPNNLSYVHEKQFLALLSNNKGNVHIDFPRQLMVVKTYQYIDCYFKDQQSPKQSYQKQMEIPGEMNLPNGWKITATYIKHPVKHNKNTFIISIESVSLPLFIRTRKTGDRMSWSGLNGSKKLKDIFIDEKIPLNERDTWPIITDNNGKILWLVGLKKGQPIENSNSNSFIQLHYEKM